MPEVRRPAGLDVNRERAASRAKGRLSAECDERYGLLVQNVRDYAIFLLDPHGIIQTWNLGAEILKGYTSAEIIGQSFTRFYSEEDRKRHHPERELEIATAEGRYEEEGWRFRKDGSRFWANVVITALKHPDGELIGFAKVTRDLSEKRKAEEALRESEERFRLIVESVKDYAIIMLDPSGRIASWNEGARRLKGYEAAEIMGRHFSIFYESDEVEAGKCEYELREAALTGRFEDEGWRVRKDGTKFWANVVITALFSASGHLRGYAKVTRDITDRKRVEDKLKMARQNLERRVVERTRELQKAVEARDEFLSIASHELRTPLAALRLQNQLLERQLAKNAGQGISADKAKEMSALTARQVDLLSRLIEDMLDVSRIASGRLRLRLERVDLSDLLANILKSFDAQFRSARIEAKSAIDADLLICGDEQRVSQVVANLLSNCIKYAPGAPVELHAFRDGEDIEVRVQDRGPGIDSADQKRVFERFERAVPANEVSGLGLGLYICRQIVESHGGVIGVKSEIGQGSMFFMRLPISGPKTS